MCGWGHLGPSSLFSHHLTATAWLSPDETHTTPTHPNHRFVRNDKSAHTLSFVNSGPPGSGPLKDLNTSYPYLRIYFWGNSTYDGDQTFYEEIKKKKEKRKKAIATWKNSCKEGMVELREKMTWGRISSELSEHGRVWEEKWLNHRNKDRIRRKTDHRYNYRY